MGFNLRREIRDVLPPGVLTPGERCLILELADFAGDESRRGYPGLSWLAQKADLSEDKIGEMFGRIAEKWVELRVPLGKGKDGRPYYTRPGKRTVYQFPALDELTAAGAAALARLETKGGTKIPKAPRIGGPSKPPRTGGPKAPTSGGPNSDKAPRIWGDNPPVSGGPSPQSFPQKTNPSSLSSADASQDDHSTPAASEPRTRERDDESSFQQQDPTHPLALQRRLLAEHCGITDPDDADYYAGAIESMNNVRSNGFWVTAARNGTLAGLAAAVIPPDDTPPNDTTSTDN